MLQALDLWYFHLPRSWNCRITRTYVQRAPSGANSLSRQEFIFLVMQNYPPALSNQSFWKDHETLQNYMQGYFFIKSECFICISNLAFFTSYFNYICAYLVSMLSHKVKGPLGQGQFYSPLCQEGKSQCLLTNRQQNAREWFKLTHKTVPVLTLSWSCLWLTQAFSNNLSKAHDFK